MPSLSPRTRYVLHNPGKFLSRVITSFRRNQGLLLSGAVAYYTLLSIIPLFTLVLILLVNVVDSQTVLRILQDNLELLVPGESALIMGQITDFMEHRDLIGWIGILVMLFFSSMAFTVTENAMSVIFFHRVDIRRRHFLVSAIIPFFFILLLGLGLLMISLISGALQAVDAETLTLFGSTIRIDNVAGLFLYLLGVAGIIIVLTAIYLVMPVGQLSVRHALVGGVTAGVLWEAVRHVLVWYFSSLSLVNIVYGSLAAAVVVLLSLEVGAVILLLGAQVIAEFERIDVGAEAKHGFLDTDRGAEP